MVQKIENIYRYVASVLMLGVFFAQTFSNAVIVGSYYLNTGAYAKNCENKDKPWLHCNGKCQMRKQLQKEDKKDLESPDRKADNKDETVLSCESYFLQFTSPSFILLPNTAPRAKTDNIPIGNACDVFHPPQLS